MGVHCLLGIFNFVFCYPDTTYVSCDWSILQIFSCPQDYTEPFQVLLLCGSLGQYTFYSLYKIILITSHCYDGKQLGRWIMFSKYVYFLSWEL